VEKCFIDASVGATGVIADPTTTRYAVYSVARKFNDKGSSGMATTKDAKAKIIGEFKRAATDTGSPEVQIALLTSRIIYLTDHMRTHKKDFSSRRGLLKLVSSRSSLLQYLRQTNRQKYLEVIAKLGLRK